MKKLWSIVALFLLLPIAHANCPATVVSNMDEIPSYKLDTLKVKPYRNYVVAAFQGAVIKDLLIALFPLTPKVVEYPHEDSAAISAKKCLAGVKEYPKGIPQHNAGATTTVYLFDVGDHINKIVDYVVNKCMSVGGPAEYVVLGSHSITIFDLDGTPPSVVVFLQDTEEGVWEANSIIQQFLRKEEQKEEVSQNKEEKEVPIALKIPMVTKRLIIKVQENKFEGMCNGKICSVVLPAKIIPEEFALVEENCGEELCVYSLTSCENCQNTWAEIRVFRLGKTNASRSVVIENNSVTLTYAAKGFSPIVIEENIPKNIIQSAENIMGDAVIIDPDPVIKVYLRTFEGNIAMAKVIVVGTSKFVSTTRTTFESCSIMLTDIVIKELGENRTRKTVRVLFKIKDNNTPVYIKNVRLKIDSTEFHPQYDSEKGLYSVTADLHPGTHKVTILVDTPGCGRIFHVKEVNIGSPSPTKIVLIIITILIVVSVVYLALKTVLSL